jgi:DNA-binding FadR family transcriptional regulator
VLKRAQPADLDHLEELAAAMLGTDDPKEVAAHHLAFHEALLHTTKNHFLVTLGTILYRFFWGFGYRDGSNYGPPVGRFRSSHGSMVQLLRSGDPDVVEQIIDLHLSPHLGDEEVPERHPDHGKTAVAKRQPRDKEKTSQPRKSRQSKP